MSGHRTNFAPAAHDIAKLSPRKLEPLDESRSKTPFAYEGNVLGSLREDQVPRFFGALTDSQDLPTKSFKLNHLMAMQNRVDTAKVNAIAEKGAVGKLPVIVQIGGRMWIADGHHRLAAAWLKGEDTARVHFKNLDPETNVMKEADPAIRIAKVDDSLGLVFGWAIVCKHKGEDYFDLNIDKNGERVPEHITEDAMLKATIDFMSGARPGNEMHAGPDKGTFVCAWPMTTDIAKSMGITTENTGLMVCYRPPADVLAKYKDGTYTGFSIEGARLTAQEIT